VWVLTDDQDIELGGLTPMKQTRELLGALGAVGEAFYVNTPICCPSRTEYLSGRMYHNVLSPDLGGCMHVNQTLHIFNPEYGLFPMMQKAGYRTGGFGKIINGQKRQFCVPQERQLTTGFDWLSVPCDEGDYFSPTMYNLVDNGTNWIETLGTPTEVTASWYQTSQIGNRSLQFIRDSVAMKRPFLAYLGPHAPHYSADAPPWAQDLFSDMKAPRTPAWNVSSPDKALHVAQNPPIDADMEAHIDIHFRDRWRAIVGVDDMVGIIHEELEKLGVLTNTYFFYSSDHGYKLGEWRIGCSKQHPYESDVHIPFFARGPGIMPGTRLTELGANIDITPTFIDIAGLPPHPEHDGKSLMPLLLSSSDIDGAVAPPQAKEAWRESLIIEYLSVGTYYNDHAKLWLAGPWGNGSLVEYGAGPYSPDPTFNESDCPASEGVGGVGGGKCYFVDSQASNNWIAHRLRNATHNYVYAESYGKQAMHTATPGDPSGKGVFKCIDGDDCQRELYNYGPITSDYPNFPVMTDERWCITNDYKTSSLAMQGALHAELKGAYCSTRRLDANRMDC
jgi:N-acetylglucosamine-6-sulfatase